MLKNNFYSIQSQTVSEQSISTIITIHPEHEIFKGHFPGKPVVPGVCMIQIVKELLEAALKTTLLFQKGHQVKFLQLWIPVKEEAITIHINWKAAIENGLQTNADFKKEDATIFKLSGIFQMNFVNPQ
jgi:3-hydroxyacyl-[acyl-carrier-protein] dehydratase